MKLIGVLYRLNNVSVTTARFKQRLKASFKEVLKFNVPPALTNVIQTGLLTGVGDIIAQHYVEGISWKDHDIRRTMRFTCVGLFFIGPIFHVWYEMFLSKIYFERTLPVVIKKVILDQGFFAPTFLVMFYGMVGLFEMGPVERTLRRIKSEFVPNMTVNYFIWPAVQLVNFYYVQKPKYNILLVNTVSIFWNCFLSWAAHKRVHTTPNFDKEHVLVMDECKKEKSKSTQYKI